MQINSATDYIPKLIYQNSTVSPTNKIAGFSVQIFNYFLSNPLLQVVSRPQTYMMTHESLLNIYHLLLQSTIRNKKTGAIIEVGCYEGLTALMLSITIQFHNLKQKLYLYDSFMGLQNFSEKDTGIFLKKGDCQTTLSKLIHNFKKFDAKIPVIIQGDIERTFPSKLPDKIVFAHIDLDLYKPTYLSLKHIYPRLITGGIIVLDDYDHPLIPGIKNAVLDYFGDENVIITKLFAGNHPLIRGIWPKYKGKYILKKYQAFITR